MNIDEAKKIDIASYLSQNGGQVARQKPGETWFLSPLHAEKHASFKVDTNKNIWYDHAQGVGGTIIDLVMHLQGVDSRGALAVLSSGNHSFSFSPAPSKIDTAGDEFEIVKVKELQNPALIQYLESRKINIEIAKKFSTEIFFKKKNNLKNLFAISFKNDIGGYETRNALFKGNIGGKAITTIRGKGTGKVAVFEGFMDFLSVLTKYNTFEITDDVIVLNSLSLVGGVKERLRGYSEIKYFLDNDKAGRENTTALLDEIGGVDYAYLYTGYKDANDWLCLKTH